MSTEERATRDGFGEALLRLGQTNERIVVVSCDLASATRVKPFEDAHPDRYFEVGIAEQNGISIAAGLALTDLRPFIASFGAFITSRYDQIRTSCAYNQAGVVIVGTHSGLAIGKDGTTQMGLEDLNVLAALPGMNIYQPADAYEAEQITEYLAQTNELAYLRLSRTPQPAVYSQDYIFRPGHGHIVKEGTDIALIATGDSVYHSLQAAEELTKDNISAAVVNMSTLKPFDRALIKDLAKNISKFVTVEDHNIIGGLGSRVSEVIAEENLNVKLTRHGVPDQFGESGDPKDLYRKYKLDAEGITEVAKNAAQKPKLSAGLAVSKSGSPRITYHVVTWNRLDKLKNLLRSFQTNNQYDNYEWILIDHGSTDGSAEFIRDIESNQEFKQLWGHLKPVIHDESEYISELKNKGIELSSPRRIAHAFYGYYRNMARSLATGDYFIDFPDDHQFITPTNWVEEMLSIYNDRLQTAGRDDISSLVFKTRRLFRIYKRNNATQPMTTTNEDIDYFVCRYKSYDDYGMISRSTWEQMGPYWQIDDITDPSVITAWNDPNNEYFNKVAPHYEHYLKKAKMLGLKKIMTKYPYTHDLMNEEVAVPDNGYVVPMTDTKTLKAKFKNLDRPVSYEEIENLLTGTPSTASLLRTKAEAKTRSILR